MTNDRDVFAEFRERYTILDVWVMLCPQAGQPKLGMNKSPFREDRSPSFSIYEQGRKFKDHGHEEHSGTAVDFAMIALETDRPGVRAYIMERLGIDVEDGRVVERKAYSKPPASAKPPKRIAWPAGLVEGSEATWEGFSKTRGWTPAGIELAVKLGVLRFTKIEDRKCYVVMDSTGRCAEIRDVRQGLFGRSKAYPLSGVEKAWLPGAVNLVGKSKEVNFLITEGAPDLISAIDLYSRYAGEARWECGALLGSKCKELSPDCAKLLKGRHVRLVPDGDEDGDVMAATWKATLLQVGCKVDVVRLMRGKDLTNLVQIIKPEVLFNV